MEVSLTAVWNAPTRPSVIALTAIASSPSCGSRLGGNAINLILEEFGWEPEGFQRNGPRFSFRPQSAQLFTEMVEQVK